MTLDPYRLLRAWSPFRGLATEIRASIFSSLYRAEYFRQGGSPRLTLVSKVINEAETEISPDEVRAALEAFRKAAKQGPRTRGEAHALPPGWEAQDLGPQNVTDPVLTQAMRGIDERILAACGLPLITTNNLERSTYSNSRQQMSVVIRDAVRPRVEVLTSALKTAVLVPMGGKNVNLRPVVDTSVLVKDEVLAYNRLVLDRVKAGVITPNEARDHLDYEPSTDEKADKLQEVKAGPGGDAENAEDAGSKGGEAKGGGS